MTASWANLGEGVHRYAEAVLEGDIIAGPGVRAACRRHFRDVDAGEWLFNAHEAGRVIAFFRECLELWEGRAAGRPFSPEPFQVFILGSLFGWLNPETGLRRYHQAYIETGKGSGKSPLLAGIGLFLLFLDGEPGAQVYAAAATRENALILYDHAKNMARRNADLARELDPKEHWIKHPGSNSIMKRVSSDANNLHGPVPHGVLADEVHAHKSPELLNVLRAGTKDRRQPLIVEITNSGYDRTTICWEHHELSLNILDPESPQDDDTWFAYVCGLEPEEVKDDAWMDDESCWIKPNPGLDTILARHYLRSEIHQAKLLPSKRNRCRQLNGCIWTSTRDDLTWVPLDVWNAGAIEMSLESLEGRECYGGLDLSSTTDLTAFHVTFPPLEGETCYLNWTIFWVANSEVWLQRAGRGIPIDSWVEQGFVTRCPSRYIDHDMVKRDILDFHRRFDLRELAVDRWNASQVILDLQAAGVVAYQFGQGYESMRTPTQETERLILEGKMLHPGNPVMAWNIQSAAIEQDPSGSTKLNKRRSKEPMDGAVAMVMAAGRALVRAEPEDEEFEFGAG